MSHEIKTKYTT